MGAFLDLLKERLEEAKARFTAAQQAWQVASAELQAATADMAVWNNALNLEIKAQEKRVADAQETQIPMILPGLVSNHPIEEPVPQAELLIDKDSVTAAINKTQKVREVIRLHESGVKPSELWTEVKDCVSSRAYMYSILKRLRDNDEVSIRRGRYVLRPKPMEVSTSEQRTLVQ